METPASARPCLVPDVLKLASTQGTSWPTWKVSHWGEKCPSASPYQLLYQPDLPPSGITTMPLNADPATSSLMRPWSLLDHCSKSAAPPWSR
jgi:hypothetical protein